MECHRIKSSSNDFPYKLAFDGMLSWEQRIFVSKILHTNYQRHNIQWKWDIDETISFCSEKDMDDFLAYARCEPCEL